MFKALKQLHSGKCSWEKDYTFPTPWEKEIHELTPMTTPRVQIKTESSGKARPTLLCS